VVFARELPKCLFDVVIAGIAGDTENLIVIFELDGHEERGWGKGVSRARAANQGEAPPSAE
jgi:hypothetical protein